MSEIFLASIYECTNADMIFLTNEAINSMHAIALYRGIASQD